MSKIDLYRIEKDIIRENLNKYTRKAFKMLPKLKNPYILDVGCGSGVPTIELVKISGGYVIGLDTDDTSLDLAHRKIKEMELHNRVSVIKNSILSMDFPKECFDIIWAEGSIFVIGFENSIKNWYRFLKQKGFLVIHDENKDKNKKIGLIEKYGYILISHFDISDRIWLHEYYYPLELLIQRYRSKYPFDSKLIKELYTDQVEIEKCKSNSIIFSSYFVILQKI